MALRLLVIEANTREARPRHRAALGATFGESYAAVLTALAPDAVCDIVAPSDPDATLPLGASLADYDGVAWTGSSLHVWQRGPEVDRQIAFAREVFRGGTPCFGSCYGLQIAAVAAGGSVNRNSNGREVSIARTIMLNAAGRQHPMHAGRPDAFDAPCSHLDVVDVLPPDCTVLASNAMAAVQAAEIRHDGGVYWAVQYHPEFDLRTVALIMRHRLGDLVEEGFFETIEAGAATVADWITLNDNPARKDLAWRYGIGDDMLDPHRRRTEIANWIERQVRPVNVLRGRG